MRERIVIVEFRTSTGTKRLEGINCRFNVNKRMCAMMNEAQISICNLSREDVEYLTTFVAPYVAMAQRKRIRIFAGYNNEDVPLIFDGDIVQALPTYPPDVWLDCKAMSGFYNNSVQTTKSYKSRVSVKNLCQDFASSNGLEINDESTTAKTLSSFEYTGDKWKALKELNEIGDIVVYEDNGVLNVLDTNTPKKTSQVPIVSEASSAMIGIPQIDNIGAEITLLFNPQIVLGSKIKLESLRIPSANGYYMIYELTHKGGLREHDFYTVLKCRRL